MDAKTILLVALLVSAASAGPTGQRSSRCATVCDESQKFFYEIGKEYEYKYEAETRIRISNSISNDATVRVSALAVIQPVTKCDFVLLLKDVTLHDSEKSDIFASEVSRRPLRFAIQNGKVEHICGSDEEPLWVINFKKGILSNIQNSMTDLEENEVLTETDVSGICETSYSSEFKDSELVITKTKKPFECDHNPKIHQTLSSFGYSFDSLVQGLPLLKSSQTCKQHISDEIISKVYCEEDHLFSPFEIKSQRAQANSKTSFELTTVRPKSSTYFNYFTTKKSLLFEYSEGDRGSSSLEKTEEILTRLDILSQNGIKKEVPTLFSELVTSLRDLSHMQIRSLHQRSEKQLRTFIVDALPLVKTAESMSAFVDLILKGEISEKEQNIWFTTLGFVNSPTLDMFSAVEPLLESSERTKALLGISSMVHNFCEKHQFCENERIIEKILRNFESRLGAGCRSTTEEEKLEILYSLKALGNAGRFINAESSLKKCYLEENPMEIRVAAVDAWRRAPCSYDRDHLLSAYVDQGQDNEIRISAYLTLMKCPTKEIIDTVKDRLTSESVNQVASFVWSHLANLQESAAFEKQWIRELIGDELLQKKFSPSTMKLSKNYESSFYLKEQKFGASIDSNVIFSDKSFLPRSSMLNLTVELFGQSVNLFEVGGRMEGFEAYIEKFFGPNGYYPEETVAAIIKNLRKGGDEQENELPFTKDSDEPKGSYYLKLFGNEILYRHFDGIEDLLPENSFTSMFDMMVELLSKGSVDFTKNYNLINSEFSFPTITGFPLRLKIDGKATIDMKLDGKFNFESLNSINVEGKLRPSAAIVFDSSMTVDAFVSKSGMKMLSTLHSSTAIDGKALVKEGKLIDLTINVPDEKTEVFEMSNKFFKIEDGVETEENSQGQEFKNCHPLINSNLGLELCYEKFIPYNPYSIFETFKTKLFLKKTDTHSSYIIRYTHTPEKTNLLFDMPESKVNKKWSFSLSHPSNKYELDVETPADNYNAIFSYVYEKDAIGYDLEFKINGIKQYKAKFYIDREIEDTHKQVTLEATVERNGKLIDINGKAYYDIASKSINGKLNVGGKLLPKISINLDLDRRQDEDTMNFEIVSIPLELSMSGKVGSLAVKEGLVNLKGKYSMYGSPLKSLTMQVEYTNINKADGRTFTCSSSIDEIGFDNYIKLDILGDNFDTKIKGKIFNLSWNIENSYELKKTKTVHEISMKHVSDIPALRWKYIFSTHYLMTPKKFLIEKEITLGEFETETKVNWNYGKNILFYAKYGNSKNFNLEIERISSGFYTLRVSDNFLRRKETHLESSLESKLGPRSIDAVVKGLLTVKSDISSSVSDFSWTITANDSELKSETFFDSKDLNRFFIIHATKSSVSINSNVGKPFNAEGKIQNKKDEKSFIITSNLDGNIFEASGNLKDKSIEGVIKYNDQEAKILTRLYEKGAEFEVQFSPTQKFAFSINYNLGREIVLEISLETPFTDWEKQDARFSLVDGSPVRQGQISITWQNTHHVSITFELKNESTVGKSNVTGFIRFSSTLDGFERFELNLKHMRDSDSINTKVNGTYNSEIIRGSLDANLEDGCKLIFELKTPILEDISVSFDLKLGRQELLTSLDFSYGTQKSTLLLKGSKIDYKNLTGSFTCQSPFLPDINITSSMQISSTSQIIEIKGNYNKQELLIHGNCENYIENQDKVCKMTAKIYASTYKIIDGNYSHKIKFDKFETDIEFSSSFLSEKSIKGHVEGRISSALSGILIGYVSGPNITGRININHEVSEGKINTEGSIEFNDFRIGINVGGKIDVNNKEGYINFTTESSWQPIDAVKLFMEHEKKETKRETNITLSKNTNSFKIYHIFEFKDSMNWSNYLKIDDVFSMKNEMEFNNSIMKHISSTTWMEKTIRFKFQKSFGEKLNIVALLDTPWTSHIQLTLLHQREESRNVSVIKIEYGNGQKLIIDGEYELGETVKFIKISVSNPDWNLKPLEGELTLKRDDTSKSFDLAVRLNNQLNMTYHMTKKGKITTGSLTFNLNKINSVSFSCKYSFDILNKEIYIEYENSEKYFTDIKIIGNLNKGTISSLTQIPLIFKDSIKNVVSYNFSKDYKQIVLETIISEKTYELDASIYPTTFELKSNCPHGEGRFTLKWQLDELQKAFSIDFVSPFKFVKNFSSNIIFNEKPNYHITVELSYDIHDFTFDGKFDGKTIEENVETSFLEQTLSVLIRLRNREFSNDFSQNSEIIKLDGKGSFDYKQGQVDFNLQLPIAGYEDNSISLKYAKDKSDFKLDFNTHIGKENFKIELQLSPLNGISIDLQSPWSGIEKVYLAAIMEKTSVKLSGRLNEETFESVLKATKKDYKNFNIMFTMKSTISGWSRCLVEANIALNKSPYKISLNIRHEDIELNYSAVLDISKNNLRFKLTTPIEEINIIEAKGNYSYQNKRLETSLTLTLNEKKLKLSGFIDDKSTMPNINVDILTPFENIKDIKFILGGSLKDEKSVNFLLKLGEHISKLSAHANLQKTLGSASVSLNFPTFGVENIDIQLSYDLESETKHILLDTKQGDIIEKYYIEGRITSNDLNIAIESPFENYKRFLITGKYQQQNEETLVFGKIIQGDEIYRFEGKLMENENGYKFESSVPISGYDSIIVNGEVSKEKIVLLFKRGLMEKEISISYMLKPNNAFVKISTPFEDLSYFAFGGEYDINRDSVSGKIFIYRNENRIDMSGFAHLSPRKSNIKLSLSLPEDNSYMLDIFYDILSKKKEARFECENKNWKVKYSVEGMLGNLNHGFIKFSSSHPDYELNGFEYKLRTKSLIDTEAFITIIQNSKEYSAGIISKIDNSEVKLKFLTPIKNYEEFGIESKVVPEAKEGKIKIMVGNYVLCLEVSLNIEDFYICIKTPFKYIEIFRIVSSYEFTSPSKHINIEAEYNNIKFQINGKIDTSLSTPSIYIKLLSPLEYLEEFELSGKLNVDYFKDLLELKCKYNDVQYLVAFGYEYKNYKGLVLADIITPFEGWKTLKLHLEIDLQSEERVLNVIIEREGITKRIYFSGKVLDGDIDFDVVTPFETIGNFKTKGSFSRSKRSVEFMMMNDIHSASVAASFNSLKIKATTPFEKASDIEFEISKNNKGGWFVNYHRNGNKVFFKFSAEPKKKGFTITIESEVPGWEFLALSGRLDPEEIVAYIEGRIDSGTIHLSGNGVFGDKSGSLTVTSHSSFDKYEEVTTKLEYNVKRNIFTFDSRSSSSDYKILIEFKRGLFIDVFVPNDEENTVANGKLTVFNGKLDITSRFPRIRTFSLKYNVVLSAKITSETIIELNGVKLFELEFERDAKENKAHLQIHGRRGKNHSMLHFHREGFNKLEFTFNRNDKEFKVNIDGSGDLPTSGSLAFTISNSFRGVPRTITGKLDVDRASSPKKLHLEVTNHLGKLYIIELTYNASLSNPRKGDFVLRTTTPERSFAPWKDISGNWEFDDNNEGKAVLKVGPKEYTATGKVGIFESDLIFESSEKDEKYYVQWKFSKSRKSRDYFLKLGPEATYLMFKLKGTFEIGVSGDVSGAFRLSRIMKNDFTFTSTWSRSDEGLSGDGTFQLGEYSGTHTLTNYKRDPVEKSATFHWEAHSNIPKFNSVVLDGSYSLAKRYADVKLSWDTDELSIKFSLDNLTLLKSENTIRFHGPLFGDSEITLSHDFSQPLEGHIKAIGNLGSKQVSILAKWSANKEFTKINFHVERDLPVGQATLHIEFDTEDVNNAKGTVRYKIGEKYIDIDLSRVKTNSNLVDEIVYKSNITPFDSARVYINADWSKGFKLDSGIEWGEKSIKALVDIGPKNTTASITTPFPKFGDVNINVDYELKKAKSKTVVLRYERGDKVVDMSFNLKTPSKKSGNLDFSLSTPFEVLKTLTLNASWKKGSFNAVYKRNDLTFNIDGNAEIKTDLSSFALKFTLPSGKVFEIEFSHDLDEFIKGNGEAPSDLLKVKFVVDEDNYAFNVKGYRTSERLYIEIDKNTSIGPIKTFHLKLDSELNLSNREGTFEVTADEFNFSVKNTFEKKPKGFYARSQFHSTLTSLPGLTIGFGRDGDSFIFTTGYGDEREISFTFKGKDHFRKGFYGKIDVPRRGIHGLDYSVTYNFKSDDKLQVNVKIQIDEGKFVDAEILYNSDGVKARLLSPWTGLHRARARRSISNDHFMADIGVDNYGITIESDSKGTSFKKGLKIEGEVFGEKYMVYAFTNLDSVSDSEGKFILESPYKNFGGSFKSKLINQRYYGEVDIDLFYTLFAKIDVDSPNNVKGEAALKLGSVEYTTQFDFHGNSDGPLEGTIVINTPHELFERIVIDGKITAISIHYFQGFFRTEFLRKIYSLNIDLKRETSLYNLDALLKFGSDKDYRIQSEYTFIKYPFNLKGKSSVHLDGEKVYSSNSEILYTASDDMKSVLEISCGHNHFDGSFMLDLSKDEIKGELSGRIEKNNKVGVKISVIKPFKEVFVHSYLQGNQYHTLDFKYTGEIASKKIFLNIDSPNILKFSVNKVYSKDSINLFLEMLIKDNQLILKIDSQKDNDYEKRFMITDANIIIPYFSSSLNVHIENRKSIVEAATNLKIYDNLNKAFVRIEKKSDLLDIIINANSTLIPGNDLNIRFAYFDNSYARRKITVETKVLNDLHSISVDLDFVKNIITLSCVSPYIPTGMATMSGSMKFISMKDLYLKIQFTDAYKTLSSESTIKIDVDEETKVDLLLRTPFENYEKLEFGVNYIHGDINHITIYAKPFNVEGEAYFGVQSEEFNAGLSVKTDIKNYEITKSEVIIPLNKFAPKISAHISGIDYELEARLVEKTYGKELYYSSKNLLDLSRFALSYRAKAPYDLSYEFEYKTHLNKFGVMFDSSLLSLAYPILF